MSKEPNTPFTGATPAQIDLIGTLSIALMTIGAPFATAWTKQYPPRYVIWASGIIHSSALLFASFSQHLWQFILTQGILLGMATCLTYMPSVTVAPTWFTLHRGLAMGIILAGTGIGGVAWPLAFRYLIESVGFRNTLRVTAGISFVLICGSGTFIRWPASQITRIQAENAASCLLYTSDAADDSLRVDFSGRRILKNKIFFFFFLFFFFFFFFFYFFFFFSSRRRHTRFLPVSWARRCV